MLSPTKQPALTFSDRRSKLNLFHAERIRNIIKENPIEDINVAVSLGAAVIQDKDESIDDIVKRADSGLYKAKNAGRDRVGWIQ